MTMTAAQFDFVETYTAHKGQFDIHKTFDRMETREEVQARGGDQWTSSREIYRFVTVPHGRSARWGEGFGYDMKSSSLEAARLFAEASDAIPA